jgi:hypothetical protein
MSCVGVINAEFAHRGDAYDGDQTGNCEARRHSIAYFDYSSPCGLPLRLLNRTLTHCSTRDLHGLDLDADRGPLRPTDRADDAGHMPELGVGHSTNRLAWRYCRSHGNSEADQRTAACLARAGPPCDGCSRPALLADGFSVCQFVILVIEGLPSARSSMNAVNGCSHRERYVPRDGAAWRRSMRSRGSGSTIGRGLKDLDAAPLPKGRVRVGVAQDHWL